MIQTCVSHTLYFLRFRLLFTLRLCSLILCTQLQLQAQDSIPHIFFLKTKPGLPPDSIFRKEYKGKFQKNFQQYTSAEEVQGYGSYRFKRVQYLVYKNRIHSIITLLDYSESNTTIQDLLKMEYGEPVQPDGYRPYMYWYTPHYFISYEDDIVSDRIEIRVVSRSVQQQFEEEHPELME